MRRITHCLNPTLTVLCKRAIELESLTATVQYYLPKSDKAQCTVGSFNKGCLILIVTDPVWASVLRYSLPELRDNLRREAGLYQLITIKINVALESNTTTQTSAPSTLIQGLSDSARQQILTSGEQCTYPPLKQALTHLGRKFKP